MPWDALRKLVVRLRPAHSQSIRAPRVPEVESGDRHDEEMSERVETRDGPRDVKDDSSASSTSDQDPAVVAGTPRISRDTIHS